MERQMLRVCLRFRSTDQQYLNYVDAIQEDFL